MKNKDKVYHGYVHVRKQNSLYSREDRKVLYEVPDVENFPLEAKKQGYIPLYHSKHECYGVWVSEVSLKSPKLHTSIMDGSIYVGRVGKFLEGSLTQNDLEYIQMPCRYGYKTSRHEIENFYSSFTEEFSKACKNLNLDVDYLITKFKK